MFPDSRCILTITAIILFVVFLSLEATPEVHVIPLNDNSFDDQISSSQYTLVMFYTPWCPHCRELKPIFEKVAGLVKSEDPPVQFGSMNCERDGKYTCSKYSIKIYPTLQMFKDGKFVEEYAGPRETEKLVGYIRRRRGPSSKVVHAITGFSAMLESPEAIEIVAFLLPENSKLDDPFSAASEEVMRKRHRPGAIAANSHIKFSSIDITAVNLDKEMMVLYRPKQLWNKFELDYVIYEGAFDEEDIRKFIEAEMHGLVGFRTKKSAEDFEPGLHGLVIIYFDVDFKKNSKGTHYWRNRVLKIAQDFKKDFTFAVSSIVTFRDEIEKKFGSEYVKWKSDKPMLIAENGEGKHFLMTTEFSVDALAEFLTKLKARKLEAFVKSTDIKETKKNEL